MRQIKYILWICALYTGKIPGYEVVLDIFNEMFYDEYSKKIERGKDYVEVFKEVCSFHDTCATVYDGGSMHGPVAATTDEYHHR